jgi:uncharacterized membrane protein YfcA
MEYLGYLASILIGIALGLIGGGGSILTVPVLVYLFGVSPLLSTSYSLFIVGSTSLVGAVNNFKQGFLNVKIALLFGLSSITTVFLTRKFIIPIIPKEVAKVGDFIITENVLMMVLFAMLMVLAAIAMIRNGKAEPKVKPVKLKLNIIKLLIYGVIIGIVTGFLGAGGGFLLIPTLVILMGLPMKEAVGTSLLIIALNSLFGFTGDLGHFKINWIFLLTITAIALVGLFIGSVIGKKIEGAKLKKGFGYFVLIMGVYIIIKEVFLKS